MQLLIQVDVSICHLADIRFPFHQKLLDHLNILHLTLQVVVLTLKVIDLISEVGDKCEVIMHITLISTLGITSELLHQT